MTQTRTPMSSSFVAALSPTMSHPLGTGPARGLPGPASMGGQTAQSHMATFVPQRMMDLRGSAGAIAWLEAVDRRLALPNSFQAFSLVVGGLLLFVAGAFLLMLPSVQIIETQVELRQLSNQYALLEQKNSETIFAIARETNMARLQERAVAQGYVPIKDRSYVILPAPAAVAASDVASNDVVANNIEPSHVPAVTSEPLLAAHSTQPNWRNWEALLGLGNPTGVQTGTPAVVTDTGAPPRWDAWWEGRLDWGQGRPWSDFTSRLLDQWSGR